MLLLSPLLFFFLRAALFMAAHGIDLGSHNEDHRGFTFPGGSGSAGFDPTDPCMVVSPPCISEADRYSLEAMRNIHQMMDDDHDGGIEVEESVEFIIEDMKEQQTNKHSNLHREDQHITVEELWRWWKSSEVHNWTQDEVLRWLKDFVELPQYERNFKDFKVNGNTLPRIASNEPAFLNVHLRVQDQRDKQKLNIKALDVVLFGPPTRPPHNYMKDLLLIVSVVMGVGGCWFAQAQNKASKIHVFKMMKDLESLQTAEQSLRELQEQLERAQEEKRNVAEEKHHLEEKMRDEIMGAQEEAHRLHQLRQGAVTELSRLRYAEEELEQVLGALKQAEKDMQATWSASEALQLWIQLTHEVEVQYYNVKKQSAELTLATAKEEAEKIKKKRSSILGTLHVAHSSSLDQVDHKILEAKNALSEVTACLRERLHRWQQIERLCGFPVFRNAGLANLTAKLYTDPSVVPLSRATQPSYSCHSSLHGSMEDLLDDPTSQMPGRSPRTRGSNICRSRRAGVVVPPPTSMMSSDPDLLLPIRAPVPCAEDEDGHFTNPKKRQDPLELYQDTDYMAPHSASKSFTSTTSADSSRRVYWDEATEQFVDTSTRQTGGAEREAPTESTEEVEASADASPRKKVKDKAMEIPTFKLSEEDAECLIDHGLSKKSKHRTEESPDSRARMGPSNDLEATADLARITDAGDAVGVSTDAASRNTCRERSDLSLDVTSRGMAARKLTRNMMGSSMDSGSRKLLREGLEMSLESQPRKLTRDLKGMSVDMGSRKLAWNKEEFQFDSFVRAMPKEKMAENVFTPARKISREELEYLTDSTSRIFLATDKMEAAIDSSIRKISREKQEHGLEPSAGRRPSRDEFEMSAGSLRRRTAKEMIDSPMDKLGKISRDRIEVETAKQRMHREEFAEPESISSSGRMGQPDLTITSPLPWKQPPEPFTSGPLCQLVYDGILEKSCLSMATDPTSLGQFSASTPDLPQCIPDKQPVPPPRGAHSSQATQNPGGRAERGRDKDKGKMSLKLKNPFKKKKEGASERVESGLQKL